MVSGGVCLAHGRVAFLRAGGISLVSTLAAAVRALPFHAANPDLDSEYHLYLLRMALACPWTAVGAARLDDTAGVRVGGSRFASCCLAFVLAICCAEALGGL